MDKEVEAMQAGAKEAAISAGWSPYTCQVTDADKEMLRKAIQSVDVEYTPVAVSMQQQVDRTNYRFFCNTRMIPRSEHEAALVQLNQSVGGKFEVHKIEKCSM